jgi:type I restriction enzyme S subunit
LGSSEAVDLATLAEAGVDFPSEWKIARLGDIARIRYGKAKPNASGNIPVIGSGGIYAHTVTALVDFPTIVVGRKGTAGEVWLADSPCWPSDTTFYLEWKKEAHLHFIFNFLRLNKPSGEHAKTTLPSLQRADLEKIVIPQPSVDEQRRIARVLATIQRAMEVQEKVIAAARELKRSLMKHLFTYGPVPVTETARVPLKETEIGPVPEAWGIVPLQSLCVKKVTDGTHKTPRYIETGVPFVSAVNISSGKIDFNSCKRISREEHELLTKRCRPEREDILLSKVGTVGIVAKVETDAEFSIFVQLALLKPNKKILNPDFLYFALSTDTLQGRIHNRASQSTMQYIGVGKIAELEIPLPSLPEQEHVAQMLLAVDRKIEAEENRKAALQALFKTMLHHLMTGKIRVHEEI